MNRNLKQTDRQHSILWLLDLTSDHSPGSLTKCGIGVDWDVKRPELDFQL